MSARTTLQRALDWAPPTHTPPCLPTHRPSPPLSLSLSACARLRRPPARRPTIFQPLHTTKKHPHTATKVDGHIPTLTVRETLSFAETCLGGDDRFVRGMFQGILAWEAEHPELARREDIDDDVRRGFCCCLCVGGGWVGGWVRVGQRGRCESRGAAAAADRRSIIFSAPFLGFLSPCPPPPFHKHTTHHLRLTRSSRTCSTATAS